MDSPIALTEFRSMKDGIRNCDTSPSISRKFFQNGNKLVFDFLPAMPGMHEHSPSFAALQYHLAGNFWTVPRQLHSKLDGHVKPPIRLNLAPAGGSSFLQKLPVSVTHHEQAHPQDLRDRGSRGISFYWYFLPEKRKAHASIDSRNVLCFDELINTGGPHIL